MTAEFLNGLPISDDERSRLAMFGAKSPLMLLNIRRASRESFDLYVGERAQFIADELTKLLTLEERESLREPPKPAGTLGARLGRAAKPNEES
jgi:hypothetical protein